jgi:molecular chaperone DnaK
VKIELSEASQVSRYIEGVLPDQGKNLNFSLTETALRDLIAPIVQRTVPVCEEAMKIAGIRPGQIDEIVLVGGTTRIPIVRETVRAIFNRKPQTSINPMSLVAVGAAIQGAALVGLLVPMADGGVSAPSMNATAVLLDVTPRSLGVRTLGGNVDRIIERNSVVPVEQTRLFTTTVDNQKYVRIEVCQGESPSFDENTKLGEVLLSGIRPAPRGETSVSVTFEINTDGLLEVRALDGQTGQEQTATMKVLGGMSPEDVDTMISKAESEGLLGDDEHEGSVVAR